MLDIAPNTLNALSAPHEEAFLRRVVLRLRADFPKPAERAGPARLREEARALIARGRRHRLASEYDLSLFVSLGVALGPTFDEDPELPWASATLNSRVLGTPSERIAQLAHLAHAALKRQGRPVVPLPIGNG